MLFLLWGHPLRVHDLLPRPPTPELRRLRYQRYMLLQQDVLRVSYITPSCFQTLLESSVFTSNIQQYLEKQSVRSFVLSENPIKWM